MKSISEFLRKERRTYTQHIRTIYVAKENIFGSSAALLHILSPHTTPTIEMGIIRSLNHRFFWARILQICDFENMFSYFIIQIIELNISLKDFLIKVTLTNLHPYEHNYKIG